MRPWTNSSNHPFNALLSNKGKAAPEFENTPPVFKFSYKYNKDFASVLNGLIMRDHWEKRSTLTSVVSVEQLDEDNVCIYRRMNHHESMLHPTYERVMINRKDLTAESIVLAANPDHSESIVERTVFAPADSATTMETSAFDTQGSVDGRVEFFKRHVKSIISAMQFKQWSEEETN